MLARAIQAESLMVGAESMKQANGGVPKHIALIMDGNGRWAVRRGLARRRGHVAGVRAIRGVVSQARILGVQRLTLFAFSTENWQRAPVEVAIIMKLLERYLKREVQELVRKEIRLRICHS